MPDFPLIDAHVHLYDPKEVRYPWMTNAPSLNKRHASEEYTAAIGHVVVEKLVFVEVNAGPKQEMAEARWVAAASRKDTRIQGMIGSLPLEQGPDAIEHDLAEFAKLPHSRGIRRLIQEHLNEPGWCLRPDFVAAVKAVGRHGLSFEICIYHPQINDAIELVRRCPEVHFMLDHIGKPGIKDAIREPWWSGMRTLAALPNVTCKISGVVTEADHHSWTYGQVAPYIAHAIECFGFDRVVFGGDWPVMTLATNYPDWVAVVDRVTAGVSREELRKLYRDNAVRHYRL